MAQTTDGPAPFEVVLYPNPPLGRYGFVVLMLAVAGVSAAVGGACLVAGAWPVTGFMALDIVLLYLAFRCAQRRSCRVEAIRLDERGLHVRQVEPDGHALEWRLEPYWVNVDVERARNGSGSIALVSHGKRLRLGRFLNEDERQSLAGALRSALEAHRA